MRRGGRLARNARLAVRTPLRARTGLQSSGQWSRTVPLLSAPEPQKVRTAPRRETGFSRSVKLQVRTRAGNGDPDQARCEATGVWLGRHGGEVQHRDARGMGGTSDPVTNSIVNAVLLSTEAHRLAESRDKGMNDEGFWLRNGQDPALTPILLRSQHGSGVTVWLSEDGGYLFEAPEVAA